MTTHAHAADTMNWKWGRGPLLNNQFPWHYPQLHTLKPVTADEIWRPRSMAVYLHTPFCEERCDYCGYAVYAHQRQDKMRRYVDALKREIDIYARMPHLQGVQVSSLYFGGGSPSILPNDWVAELFDRCREAFDVLPDAEICIEANPIDVDEHKVAAFKRLGVNRVSVGVQSFDEQTLASMNRSHSPGVAIDAFRLIKNGGLRNVNLDLIYAYPTQTLEQLARTIEQAIALDPDRISCASLSIFPKTALYVKTQRGALQPVSEDGETAMFELTVDLITRAGYDLETILCFCKPGVTFRQEDDVLRGGVDLLGLGLSAFSIVNGYVCANASTLPDYYERVERGQPSVARGRKLDVRTRMAQTIIQGLRYLVIDRPLFEERFGVTVEQVYGERLDQLVVHGFLTVEHRRYRLTRTGMLHIGPVMREFYDEPPFFNQTYQGELVQIGRTATLAGAVAPAPAG